MKAHKKNIFLELCREIFRFLEEDFGCKVVSVKEDVYGDYITYQNLTTAIRIALEPREGGVTARLYRLISGKIPDYPVSIKSETTLHVFYLDDLIALRAPSTKVEQPLYDLFPGGGPNVRLLKQILAQYARVLREYGSEILKGDFRVFVELDKIVKKRAATRNRGTSMKPGDPSSLPRKGNRGTHD